MTLGSDNVITTSSPGTAESDSTDANQPTGRSPAATAEQDDAKVSKLENVSKSTEHDQGNISTNNSGTGTNANMDHESLDTAQRSSPQTQLPRDGSLGVGNASSADDDIDSNASNMTGDSLNGNTNLSNVGNSLESAGDGNQTATNGLECDAKNRTAETVNQNGTGTNGVNRTENQNETVPSGRNGTQAGTGSHTGGSGLTGSALPLPTHQREKSVFLRLSNHIDDLQTNMTLFSIFLDQISSNLKKNKNKTEETTKLLDRRISMLNESFLSFKGDINSKLEVVSELRDDVLQLMKSISSVSYGLLDLQLEVYVVLVVLVLLQITIIFIILISCLWQCYSNHTLRMQVRDLIKANSNPPSRNYSEVESLGEIPRANGANFVSKTKTNSLSSSNNTSVMKAAMASNIQRSSSASLLSDVGKSMQIQAKLSQSDYLGGSERGMAGGGRGLLLQDEEEEEDMWLGSNSMPNLDGYGGPAHRSKKRKSKK